MRTSTISYFCGSAHVFSIAFSLCFIPVSPIQGFHIMMPSTTSIFPHARMRRQLSANSVTEDQVVRQIFYDYDKPIVLIGASGAGSEMSRLASSFHTRRGAMDNIERILRVNMDTNEDNLIKQINELSLRWPQILLVDFNGAGLDVDDDKTTEHQLSVARRLYECGLLSVYVNVDRASSNMPEAVAHRKAQLEDNHLIKYSDYEICIRDEGLEGNEQWEHIEWEFQRLLARARLIPAIPGETFNQTANSPHLTMGKHTFFLSLSFPNITQVEPFVEEMSRDVDAMEYRADLLDCRDNRFDLIYGMQLLRRYCRPHCVRVPALPFGERALEDVMPIVYTVRTKHQAGTYPDDDAGIAKMFSLLRWGLRAGVEVLDVESAWVKEEINSLLLCARERYASQILGSEHVVGRSVTTTDAVTLFQQCALDGRAHGAKVVLSIDREGQDRMAHEAALIASSLALADGKPIIPHISLILGDIGKFSRVINLPFTPVTHESLPMKAAPGQMTSSEIMTTRILTKIFTPRKYCIVGHKIAYSVSPQMHGAAFAATKLPHDYIRVDTESIEEFINSNLFKSGDFGGASVTIPHKQAIMPYVDILSDAAKEIGSVNTLLTREVFEDGEGFQRVLYGDNTDWKGIYNPLKRLLGNNVRSSCDYALILGAGGTARAAAYVVKKLGLRCLFHNRTPSKATHLAASFGGQVLSSLDEQSSMDNALGNILDGGKRGALCVVISTLPAAAEFVLPDWVLESKDALPVVFDVNYKPFNTKLVLQAKAAGCRVVRGSEMLWEQGIGQFELWTDRTAPYRVMKQVVLRNCDET
ncbi:hypothetical protein MPSEU_000567000 [Mayamaea pseudoterrestris]|nr:hypothetical protein MPSEU_000567000 [Mayamaea pseudoterrestris]